LFDEPLSNLDAKLRTQMRAEIRRLHNRLGVTSIYVTHDQVEAMTLADRIVVMNDGNIEQVGTPMELFMNPANTFVAGFLGSPPMNQLDGILNENGAEINGVQIKLNAAIADNVGRKVVVGIRPEDVTLQAAADTSVLPIELDLVEPLGSEALLHAKCEGTNLVFKTDTNGSIDHLSGIKEVHVPAERVKIFDAENGQAISL
jgi:multiple sugar transport system ATP-binding protein